MQPLNASKCKVLDCLWPMYRVLGGEREALSIVPPQLCTHTDARDNLACSIYNYTLTRDTCRINELLYGKMLFPVPR